MSFSPLVDELIESLRCLPGVGSKSAQRMALQLLERDRRSAARLSTAITASLEGVGRCQQCQNLAEQDVCRICSNERRNIGQVCIVETPSDLMAIEQSGNFNGRYFVLMGHLSPIDGIGPEEIGIDKLLRLITDASIHELILATNSTVEGDATALYIADLLEGRDILVTRIAHGIPVGGQLGYVDGGTLGHALAGRKPIED